MQKRIFSKINHEVSALGFGIMRMPCKSDGSIDEKTSVEMIRHAIDSGIDYIDTAYVYHGGYSERVVGKALKDGYREKVSVATKSPVWEIKEDGDFERLLDEQLERLEIDCIDFYLLHALDKGRWFDTVLKFDLLNKMIKAREDGKIKYIGFSFHDGYDAFMTIIDGFDWDFCQVQMNYIDINNQATIKGMKHAYEKGISCIVMEPLLGGKLANPPVNLKEFIGDVPPVKFALDFVWNMPEVSTVLSGMSAPEQLEENLRYASEAKVGMLDEKQLEKYEEAKKIYDTQALVQCTKCAYCMPCPAGLDIPKIYEAYNQTVHSMDDAYNIYMELDLKADACIGCKACEDLCPQAIGTAELMPKLHEIFSAFKK